jgi:hypothetical protein
LSSCSFNETPTEDIQIKKYGEKVSYSSGKEFVFPDFTLKFVGKREEKISNDWLFTQKMTFYDFEVAKGETRQTISWSSGMGDIEPAFFTVKDTEYVLELRKSDVIKGSLGNDILVIWKKSDYLDVLSR